MRPTPFIALLAAGALGLVACGSDSDPEPDAPAAAADVVVASSQTELGTALVGDDDRTLYGFTADASGESTCNDACATTWPPVLVEEDYSVAAGLERSLFSTVRRRDGKTQLVAGDWPLYSFSGDAEAGDTNGQGSGGAWFAVGADAALIKTAPETAPAVGVADSELGQIVVDAEGRTLYGFSNDSEGDPTCVDACAQTWPAATAIGSPTAEGIDAALLSVVDHPEAGSQLKVGTWPLYYFVGDAAPGDVQGQGSGGVWFAVGADGALVRS